LKPATWYDVYAFIENNFGMTLGGKDSLCTLDGIPKVGVIQEENRGFTDIKLSSRVTNGGDETVLIAERGFCWSIEGQSTTPDTTNYRVICGVDTGYFEGIINGLEAGIKYYARAYAKSNLGITGYSDNTIQFQTMTNVPTVITGDVENIENGGADVGGYIDNVGMSAVISSGICWSATNPTPTDTTDNILSLTAVGPNRILSGRLTKLRGGSTTNRTYYVRAYATNSQGTGYGEVKQFQAPPIFTINGLMRFPGVARRMNTSAYFALGGGYLYILGGDNGSFHLDDFWRYSLTYNEWEPLWPFSGGPMKGQSGVAFGTNAFVYGGKNGNGDEKPGIYEYKPSINEWEYHAGPDSAIVNQVLGFPSNQSIYYVGGMLADNTVRDDVWSFTPGSRTWQRRMGFPVKQCGGIAVVIGNISYAGMGRDANDVCNDSIWISDDWALTWNYKTSYTDAGMVWGGVMFGGRLFIIDKDYYFIEYNPETDLWTKKSQLPSYRQVIHCIYAVGSKIYIGLAASELTVYDPSWDND
jgi:hypothetical protein